jgi:CO/xanthine dehydrogenase FAD-binding subunit
MRLFDYHRPTTLPETLDLLADLGDEAELLAGGTSLMNMAKLGLAEPEHVIALAGVPELHGLTGSAADGLTFGAMATIRDVETSPSCTTSRRASPRRRRTWPPCGSATRPPSAATSSTPTRTRTCRPC